MKRTTLTYNKFVLLVCIMFGVQTIVAQDYSIDSLQIKVYTEIKYAAGTPQQVSLKKVFCNYCSKRQLQLLGEDAIRRAESEMHDPKNKIIDGIKKLAVYIRIAKADFARINDNE